MDELGKVGAVHGQHLLKVYQLEVRIAIGLLLFHPFFQRPTVFLVGLRRLFLLGRMTLHRLPYLLPRVPAEQNEVSAVNQGENDQPLLGESPRMFVGNTHIRIHRHNQETHKNVSDDTPFVDVLQRGEVILAPKPVFPYVGKQQNNKDKRIQCNQDAQIHGKNIIQRQQRIHGQDLKQGAPESEPARAQCLCGEQQQGPAQQIPQRKLQSGEFIGAHIHHGLAHKQPGNDVNPVQKAPKEKRKGP